MTATATPAARPLREKLGSLDLLAGLGVLLGIVMPVVSAVLFPGYYHLMPTPWQNRAMLLELQYVACEVAIIAWAYARGMDRDRMWRALPADIRAATLVLLGAMLAGSVFIAAHPEALLQSLIVVVHLYFAIAVFYLARSVGDFREEAFDALLRWLAIGLFVLGLYTLWRFQFPPPASEIPGGKIEWFYSLPGFICARYLGIWCGAVAAGLLIRILYRDDNRSVGFWHLAFVFAVAFAAWTGTRASLLGMAGAAAAIAVMTAGLPNLRGVAVAAGLTVLALVLALIFQFPEPGFGLWRFGGTGYEMSSGRTVLWLAAIDRWEDSPLLGWGTGSFFWEVYVMNWTHTQPHNAFLQFLFSWGIIGAVPATWLLARAVKSANAIARSRARLWPLMGMTYALLWMSMVDGTLYYPRFVVVIVAGLAIALAARASDPHAERSA